MGASVKDTNPSTGGRAVQKYPTKMNTTPSIKKRMLRLEYGSSRDCDSGARRWRERRVSLRGGINFRCPDDVL
jgi:hypothetical protein